MTMLISLHLPKTAGESFYNSLKDHFGDGLLRDYADKPINTPVFRRNTRALLMSVNNRLKNHNGTSCIHGHFLPLKYRLMKDAVFVTWLRDPLERLASHYHYWFRTYDPETAPVLRRKVVEENWSLEKFCLSPEFRNLYSQFLWGFPLRRFAFIGITEYFETDLQYFCRKFLRESAFKVYEKKQNLEKDKGSYFKDDALKKSVARYHRKDLELYQQALQWRSER